MNTPRVSPTRSCRRLWLGLPLLLLLGAAATIGWQIQQAGQATRHLQSENEELSQQLSHKRQQLTEKNRHVSLAHPDCIRALAWSPDGKLIATGDEKGVLRLWDAASRRLLEEKSWEGHLILSLAFRPDGGELAVLGMNRAMQRFEASASTLSLWEVAPLKQKKTHHCSLRLDELRYSPDGNMLVLNNTMGTWPVSLLHARTLEPVEAFWRNGTLGSMMESCGMEVLASELSFSPDGKYAAMVAGRTYGDSSYPAPLEPCAFVWNMEAATEEGMIPLDAKVVIDRCRLMPVFSPDGTQLLTAGGKGVHVLPVERQSENDYRLKEGTRLNPQEECTHMAYSPDGSNFLTVSEDAVLRFHDARSLQRLSGGKLHSSASAAPVYSPDGRTVAIAGSREGENAVYFIDVPRP